VSSHTPLFGGQYRRFEWRIPVWPWLIQQTVALFIPIFWELFLARPVGLDEVNPSPALGDVGVQILNPLAILVLGSTIGFCLRATAFKNSGSGKYVWILPFALVTLGIAYDLFVFDFNWKVVSQEFFYWSSSGDEGPILRDLMVYPTLSSLAYSLGVLLYARMKG
jgi:hypothetical protein